MAVQQLDSQKIVKTVEGVVTSDKMDKTVVVMVERKVRHAKYEKILTRSTKFHVHDEENIAKTGDKVLIKQSRPRSKTKAWALVSIVENAK
ncbi:MAG: 30S ribosomal protein S17 [Gammaproteobacteria bacterium]|jgi:small subunit ribosomal protein S17|nr:30S ribosomal protein S17 [Gammaproteobacteria bacterium]